LYFSSYLITETSDVWSKTEKFPEKTFIPDNHTLLWGVKNLLSETIADLKKTRPEDLDKEILRAAMIAELDAVNIYEQMSNLAKSEEIRKILLDIAREEKIHVAMFETVLLQADEEFLQVYIDYALARR
jgi:rubrerythrin